MTNEHDQEIAEESQHTRDGTNLKVCAHCGAEIDPTCRHLATTAPDDPSTVYLFCSDDCRDRWADDGDAD